MLLHASYFQVSAKSMRRLLLEVKLAASAAPLQMIEINIPWKLEYPLANARWHFWDGRHQTSSYCLKCATAKAIYGRSMQHFSEVRFIRWRLPPRTFPLN